MTSQEIRQKFLDFFASKQHKIVASAPIVNKDDPTLMFTNAGMNQFKDFFLGNKTPDNPRIADTQKCLRVSGKHNDLEEVGIDSYHQTMFEMLGNWSIGDYFKKEAIDWAWELLVTELGLPTERLYATVFEGDEAENLEKDQESADLWKAYLPEDRILYCSKKDNFWEMGDTGPCGPCSEIHIDLRSDEARAQLPGSQLVNQDDPMVVEIWNLVFIQFNRKANGKLEELPDKHVDTGMGFERLCMAIQGKTSNYDTDIFTPFIEFIEKASSKKYGSSYDLSAKADIAMRVVADHVRAVAFSIADGQLPSNTGAGYVIRRILRRAVRYYYSFLDIKTPFLHQLIPLLAERFKNVFPELEAQKTQVAKVILGEEKSFLRTLENGIKRFEALKVNNGIINGKSAFELYDTYGFPIDLTRLMAAEKSWQVDEVGFKAALEEQRQRSQADAQKEIGDWFVISNKADVDFVGYDELQVNDARVVKYRTVKLKNQYQYQIVLDKTPFYGESGGQAGDTGLLWFGKEKIPVLDTQKENDLIIHIVKNLPRDFSGDIKAEVNALRRRAIENNHSATHLLHAALHKVLGKNALQKGQNVDNRRLRFDFSHSEKVNEEELKTLETIVNQKVRANIPLEEDRDIPIAEAEKAGATMLFGEKYGDLVRMITFDPDFSRELCGGTHVPSTGHIGLFKILSETGVAAGIRRIEAITADTTETFVKKELEELAAIRTLFKNPKNTAKSIASLQDENRRLKNELEKLLAAQATALKGQLKSQMERVDGVNFIGATLPLNNSNTIKNLAYQLEKEVGDAVIVFGAEIKGKPQLMVTISRNLIEAKALHAGIMIRQLAREIKGGGGGQAFFATAGGKDTSGLERAIVKAKELVQP